MHRPIIILASFAIIGFAFFYFQPGVDRADDVREIFLTDNSDPMVDGTTDQQSGTQSLHGSTVMSSDVADQLASQPVPMPTGLETPVFETASSQSDAATSEPPLQFTISEPEVTRAAGSNGTASTPNINLSEQGPPSQPSLSAAEPSSEFFETLGERPLLLTATVGNSGQQEIVPDLDTQQTQTDVMIPSSTPPAAVETSPASLDLLTTHTVRRGDSLSKIATLYYGDRDGYTHIFAANRDVLNRPNSIEIGQVLKIPLVAAYE